MTSWSNATTRWTLEMQAAGKSPQTIRLRRYWIGRFAREIAVTPADVTRDQIVEWLAAPGWEPETRKTIRTSIVTFFAWAHDEGHLRTNPAIRIPSVRVPPGEPRPAEDDDVRAALAKADPRVSLMLMLAVLGGLRRAEVASCHRSNLTNNSLRVTGKGGRTRTVPLPRDLANVIRRQPDGYLFPSPKFPHLLPDTVGKLMTDALPDGVTPHMLRHAAASAWHDAGLTHFELMRLLGHASATTTQRYVRVRDTRLANAVQDAAQRFAA